MKHSYPYMKLHVIILEQNVICSVNVLKGDLNATQLGRKDFSDCLL